uniref:Uncharacterized protein n=1 Tax=Anguilla anguilla TaxID=7936 RepID=A0A0E9S2Q0_ANGAN
MDTNGGILNLKTLNIDIIH